MRVMGNDFVGLCEVFGSELKGDLRIEYCVIQRPEQTEGIPTNLWVVVRGVPVLSNPMVMTCVGAPGTENNSRQRWRRKT